MVSYKLSAAAKEDLRRIYTYGFYHFGERQADAYFHSLFDAFERMASQPLTFQSVEHIRPGYRRCVCGSDSIYFKLSGDCTVIMAILGGQNTEQWLGEALLLSNAVISTMCTRCEAR